MKDTNLLTLAETANLSPEEFTSVNINTEAYGDVYIGANAFSSDVIQVHYTSRNSLNLLFKQNVKNSVLRCVF